MVTPFQPYQKRPAVVARLCLSGDEQLSVRLVASERRKVRSDGVFMTEMCGAQAIGSLLRRLRCFTHALSTATHQQRNRVVWSNSAVKLRVVRRKSGVDGRKNDSSEKKKVRVVVVVVVVWVC